MRVLESGALRGSHRALDDFQIILLRNCSRSLSRSSFALVWGLVTLLLAILDLSLSLKLAVIRVFAYLQALKEMYNSLAGKRV